jgi:hypothetical protein
MEAWSQDLNGLFGMFHDFTITEVLQQRDRITLRVVIPWGEMLLPPDHEYTITVEMADCSGLSCTYWTLSTAAADLLVPAWERRNVEWNTTDPATISALGLEVQRHLHTAPDHYLLQANSDRSIQGAPIAGGEIRFNALAFRLYDAEGRPMMLADLQGWGIAWWQSIEDGELRNWPRP